MNERDKKKNYASVQAKREFEARNKEAAKVDKEALKGAAKVEAERIKLGGVNFALYNLILSVVNFKDCHTAADSCRRTYEGIYPYIRRIQEENIHMRHLLMVNECKEPKFLELCKNPADLQEMAANMLNKITAAARKRAKSPIKVQKLEIV